MFKKLFGTAATLLALSISPAAFANSDTIDPIAAEAVEALQAFHPDGFYNSRSPFLLLMNANLTYSSDGAAFNLTRATGVFAADEVYCSFYVIPSHSGESQKVALERSDDEVVVEVTSPRGSCSITVTRYKMSVRNRGGEEMTLRFPRRLTDGRGQPVDQ